MRVRRVLIDAGIELRPNPYVLTPDVVTEMIRLKTEGIPNTELARRYSVSHQAISRALSRRSPSHLPQPCENKAKGLSIGKEA